ncbi:MAG: YicC family protein [Prevotella sp.]|nr:YicC family protein [Prevotella sp.]
MLLSMTGYGKASRTYLDKTIHVEVKTLNSKALDCSTRIAPVYREKEMEIRRMIQDSVVRGKVDFSIWITKDESVDSVVVNTALAADYHRQIAALQHQLGLDAAPMTADTLVPLIMRMPDIFTRTDNEELTEEEWTVAHDAIAEALAALEAFRRQEGEALRHKFEEKLDNIASLMKQIEPYEQSRVEKIRQRLTDNLRALPGVDYDAGRLEQELIYYIEKLDISEEKQRLANHLKYFRDTMDEPLSQGKKLGFIAQEMGREINTTGSKSNQAEMQNIVVQMKDELEQIKEQVLNAL